MITAIIAEYNPLTNGHILHMEKARLETGADTIMCVMSGSFSERGDSCIADKYRRAQSACLNGADIVIELPTLYAISPADYFAYGAIKTLKDIREVKYLSFGSECGNVEMLEKTADILANEPEELSEKIKLRLQSGTSYPRARSEAFDEYVSSYSETAPLKGILDGPNNVLGIAYITAIRKFNADITPHTVKREGGLYNDSEINTDYPSASAIRQALYDGRITELKESAPKETLSILETYRGSENSLGDMILFKIKKISGYELAGYHDFTEGLHNRFKICAETSSNYKEFLEKVKTKKYTMARIKRLCLNVLFDITEDYFKKSILLPSYQHVLAMKKDRTDILSTLSYLPNLMVRYSDVDKKVDKAIRPLVKLDRESQGLLSIINKDSELVRSMILV